MRKLSVAVITMNRSKQLAEALESCFACVLPNDIEFIVIDNASTDDTEFVVHSLFKKYTYSYYYEKMSENLGVGKGRNYAYLKSHGEYVYFLDDDAYIGNKDLLFFTKALSFLDKNPAVVTLTTQIYDLIWKANRVPDTGPPFVDGLQLLYMFCGGSHFLRRSFWGDTEPYFPNEYGYEEVLPSLRVADAGFVNAFAPGLLVIHNPQVNKWNFDDDKNEDYLIKELVCQRVMKTKFYPKLFGPIVYFAYLVRSRKYLTPDKKRKADQLSDSIVNQYVFGKRIKIFTVFSLWRKFGLGVF